MAAADPFPNDPIVTPAGAPGETRGRQPIAAVADPDLGLQYDLPFTKIMGLDLRLRSAGHPIL